MKNKKTVNILVGIVIVLSIFASAYGVFSKGGSGKYEFTSIWGEKVSIYGKGLYKNDSVSVAAQGRAQDVVTLFVAVPFLLLSLYLSNKGMLKGRLLLTGFLGYFLYTYTSYCFLAMYNPLFLIYIVLMSSSFFAFTLMMMSFNMESLKNSFTDKLPVKFIGGFLIFTSVAILLMWLKRIVPSILSGSAPLGIEHYTTLPIQALDLGFILPAAITSAILIMRKKPMGYLLSSVLLIKFITLLTAITAMIIAQALSGVSMSLVEIMVFPIINLIIIYPLFLILGNIKEER